MVVLEWMRGMNWWTIVIYGAAAVIALQGLFALMTVYRQAAVHRIFEEELQRRQQAAAQEKPGSTGRTA